jgi:hypothetical protein
LKIPICDGWTQVITDMKSRNTIWTMLREWKCGRINTDTHSNTRWHSATKAGKFLVAINDALNWLYSILDKISCDDYECVVSNVRICGCGLFWGKVRTDKSHKDHQSV